MLQNNKKKYTCIFKKMKLQLKIITDNFYFLLTTLPNTNNCAIKMVLQLVNWLTEKLNECKSKFRKFSP